MLIGLISRYWRGEGPLWRIFWLYGVVFSVAGALPVAIFAGYGRIPPGVTAVGILLGAVYSIWILVGVWRCAFNIQGRPLGQPAEFWGSLARALTIAWAINFVGLSAMIISANVEFYSPA